MDKQWRYKSFSKATVLSAIISLQWTSLNLHQPTIAVFPTKYY